MFLCVVTQPLGLDVVPDVYIMSALRSRGRDSWNGGSETVFRSFALQSGVKSVKGTSLTSSRRAIPTFSKAGWITTNEGCESLIV